LIREKINDYDKMVSMIEKLSYVNEELKFTSETLKFENEEIQEEMKKLREEHELMALELEEAMQGGGGLDIGNANAFRSDIMIIFFLTSAIEALIL
jgi:hypothetical protein